MADTFGANQLPLQPGPLTSPGAQATPQPAQDRTLGTILDFTRAFLITDQNATSAWGIVGLDPAHPPIVALFTYNPDHYGLQSESLPALFGWRDGGKFEWIAEDWETEVVTIKLLWVLPLVLDEDQQRRDPFGDAFIKAVYTAFSRGRTPSWVVSGDEDPLAATHGSFLGTYLHACTAYPECISWKPRMLATETVDGKPAGHFAAFELTLQLREKLTVDIDDESRFQPTSADNGDDLTIVNPATGEVQVEGYLAGTPVVD